MSLQDFTEMKANIESLKEEMLELKTEFISCKQIFTKDIPKPVSFCFLFYFVLFCFVLFCFVFCFVLFCLFVCLFIV